MASFFRVEEEAEQSFGPVSARFLHGAIKSTRKKWTGHIVCTNANTHKYLYKNQKATAWRRWAHAGGKY
jgi:hypothetical protein